MKTKEGWSGAEKVGKYIKKGTLRINWIVMLLILSINIVGCSKETSDASYENLEESGEQITGTVAQSEEKQDSKEELSEVEEESEIQIEEADPMEEWLSNVGLEGICLAVWNENDGTQHIMEEGEFYAKKEGDRFFLCTPSFMIKINSQTNSGMEFGESTNDYYCEVVFNESERDDDIRLAITCQNGETGNISFTLAAPTPEGTIVIPDDYQCYLQDSAYTGENLLGVNVPEGYTDSSMDSTYLEYWKDGNSITIYEREQIADVYEGIADSYEYDITWDYSEGQENVTEHYIERYTEKGEFDIGYAIAKLYDVYQSCSDERGIIELCYEAALVEINGHYMSINYKEEGAYDMIQSNNITNIMQEFFVQ